jgi:DNA-binding response OmpR family regulator
MPVLLVEDDPTLLEFLKILLHHSGLRDVESASRGDAALDAIRSDAFDAIVLDLALPAMSGVEVIRKVRETHPHLVRRIIVLTAVSQVVLKDLQFAPLLWDVIRKPFDIERLTRSLTTCMLFTRVHALSCGTMFVSGSNSVRRQRQLRRVWSRRQEAARRSIYGRRSDMGRRLPRLTFRFRSAGPFRSVPQSGTCERCGWHR